MEVTEMKGEYRFNPYVDGDLMLDWWYAAFAQGTKERWGLVNDAILTPEAREVVNRMWD